MNVMITGAAGGLGRTFANECARRGYNLFLTDINEEGLLCLKRGLERQFDVVVTKAACDLTDAENVDRMLDMIDKYEIRFDMLLNIAGLDYEGGFMERDREKLVKIVSLNNAATLRITHAVFKRRRTCRPFTIVFVSSLASMFPMPLKATYAATKRFLLDFAVSLRHELKNENVNILTLCPGGMVTTNETMCSIRAQGFWGNVTTNPLEFVARKTIDHALTGKNIYVPGKLNQVLSFLSKIIPRSWAAALIYMRCHHVQSKWMKNNSANTAELQQDAT